MAKAATPQTAVTPPAPVVLQGNILLDVRPMDIAKTRSRLVAKLRTAILEIDQGGDLGAISTLMNDIRALDWAGLIATKPDPEVAPAAQRAPTREEADAAGQRLAQEVARKESARAVLTEIKGKTDEEAEEMVK